MFKTYSDAYKSELGYRLDTKFDDLCIYGVKPLDDALLAIAKDELIVIASNSGLGKTELSIAISRTNAMRGKKVAHYNLEGGWREAIARMKWRDICSLYFKEHSGAGIELDYRKWLLNKGEHPLLSKLEAQIYEKMREKLGETLYLYDNPEGLTCDSFCDSLAHFEGLRIPMKLDFLSKETLDTFGGEKPDLIVIDHLHYFRFPDEKQEIRAMTEVMLKAKEINQKYNIPIILVAHLRKCPRGHGIPSHEDIYGTSNIYKIANTCIILAPDYERDNAALGLYPTYIRIAKSRQGLRSNHLMYCNFDIHTRKYEDFYELYRCYPHGEVAEHPIPENEKPAWARNAGGEIK